jgi:hypothetical protein
VKKLEELPRPMLIFIVLFLGAAFFFIANPPRTICDVQVDVFRENQSGYIFPKGKKQTSISSLYKRSLSQCELGNTLGACLEYFSTLRQFTKDLGAVQRECLAEVIEVKETKEALGVGIKTLAMLAWGEEPPDLSAPNRYGWLEMAELAVYCDLKNIFIRKSGEDVWNNWTTQLIGDLPGANKIPFDDAFMRSLFSLRCESVY